MNVFVFVLDLITNTSITTKVTNSANPAFNNISSPGLLEKKLGLDQGMTVLLYEYFYVC